MSRTDRTYSDDEICELLEKAELLGFSLEKGSELENLSLDQLAKLVETRQ